MQFMKDAALQRHPRREQLDSFIRMFRRVARRIRGTNERCITLSASPSMPPRGRVLLSYIIDGVLTADESRVSYAHPHFWETRAMADAFRAAGYEVDVIHWTRRRPLPRTDYDIYVDVRRNFDRFAKDMPEPCLRIAHMDTAHHRVHNGNQLRRLAQLKERRGIALKPFKLVEENLAAEHADIITVLGNEFTRQSFAYANKPVCRIPLSNAFTYPFPDAKDFEAARRQYLWFGSEGFVHKGLDLVLEAFAGMPDLQLVVCGPVDREPAFQKAFADLLYGTANIRTEGWIDVAGPRFAQLAAESLAMIYPSCSEGGGGCVITAMHAGLIPVASAEASVDIKPECGILLDDVSVKGLQSAVRALVARSGDELRTMAKNAWLWAREHHSREKFARDYRAFVDQLETLAPNWRSRR